MSLSAHRSRSSHYTAFLHVKSVPSYTPPSRSTALSSINKLETFDGISHISSQASYSSLPEQKIIIDLLDAPTSHPRLRTLALSS